MNDFLYPSNSKVYKKEPWYNKTLLLRTIFASPLAPHYIEVLLYFEYFGYHFKDQLTNIF